MRTLAGISLLLILGLLLGASMLVYAAYVLLAVFWVSRYLSRRWTEAVRCVRTMSASALEIGEEVSVQLRLDNRDSIPIAWVLVDDTLPSAALLGPPPALHLSGDRLRICSIAAKSSRIVTYKLKALRRGYFQIGPTVAETGDLFGLHRRFRLITQPTYLLVLPRIIPLAGYDVSSSRPIGEMRAMYRLLEDPTMISGIRQYQNGDPLRSIHWRATARTGELQCKQYQPSSVAGATLILDLHQATNPDRHEPMRSDLAVTAAASMCHVLLQMQQPFALISNGRDAVDRFAESRRDQEFISLEVARQTVSMRSASDRLRPIVIPTGKSAEHFEQIHKTLARLERTDGLRLDELLLEVEGRMARDTTLIIILQDVDESAALALGMLRRRGYSVTAIVNSYENDTYASALSKLTAQHIAVYHLPDEAAVPGICTQMVLRY